MTGGNGSPRARGLVRVSALAALVLVAGIGSPVLAQEKGRGDEGRRDRHPITLEEMHRILHGLEMGADALERLGRRDALEHIEKIADGVRREIRQEEEARERRGHGEHGERGERRGHGEHGEMSERQILTNQIEVLKLARKAYLEAEKRDAADLVRWAIRAREVSLEGRRDEEAAVIRERAPGREKTIGLLVHAEALYREWGNEERAAAISRGTERLWQHGSEREHGHREGGGDRRHREGGHGEAGHLDRAERQRLEDEIEIMATARPALAEAGRKDTLELLDRALHARKVTLAGRTDPEAMEIRQRAPELGEQVEILRYAADLWLKFGHEGKAKPLDRLASAMWERRDRHGEGGGRGEKEHARRRAEEKEILAHQIEVFEIAAHGFREVEKADLAEMAKRSVLVRQARRKGVEGEKAEAIRKMAPKPGQEIEMLQAATRIWKEFGNAEKAQATARLAEQLAAHHRERREKEKQAAASRKRSGGGTEDRLHRIEGRLEEIEELLRALRREVKEARGASHY